jgi:hypothetical protein
MNSNLMFQFQYGLIVMLLPDAIVILNDLFQFQYGLIVIYRIPK